MTLVTYKRATLTEREALTIPLAEVYSHFESLGNNCEFGIVQRHAGIDPPGLFRNVGFLDVEQIIKALSVGFEGMFEGSAFDFSLPPEWPDWRLECRLFGFGFHTTIPSTLERGSREWNAQSDRVIGVFRFLVRKIKEELAAGDKIFVFRSLQAIEPNTIGRLLSAVQGHGESALLFARVDASKPRGTLEFAEKGLVLASFDRLSNENPPVIDFASWEKIARMLIRSNDRIWRSAAPDKKPDIATPGIATTDIATFASPAAPPGALPVVMTHAIQGSAEVSELFALELEGLRPEAVITVSAWIYLSADFKADDISLVCLGFRTENFTKPDFAKTNQWQRIAITTRIPPGQTRAVPTLSVTNASPSVLRSAGWTVRAH